MTKTFTESEYYYAGYTSVSSGKLGHHLASMDDEQKDIYYTTKKNYHGIGEIVTVKTFSDGKFNSTGTGRYLEEDDQRRIDAKIQSKLNYEEYLNRKEQEKAKKDSTSFDNMTIAECKAWCGKNYGRRRQMKAYLEARFL